MSEKTSKEKRHYLDELKEMLQESKESKEKVFPVFCQRHGISMEQCRKYYDELMSKEKTEKESKRNK